MVQSIVNNKLRISYVSILLLFGFAVALFLSDLNSSGGVQESVAATATTSVTVLNIPPGWTVDPAESPASATSTPTNVGSLVTFTATATDGNGEDYYLLICKTGGAPTPNSGAAPTCNGGAPNLWAVSTSTISGNPASISYTALVGDAETNAWYAWICDGNVGDPACNASYRQGSGDAASPFHVNHRPTFTVFTDTSPALPGVVVTWNSTASDPDSTGGADTVQLFVCKANDFTGSACGAGGTWATSTFVVSDPSATTSIAVPTQDGNENAYGFIIDEHGFAASGGQHGADSVLTISNATPSVASSSMSVNGGVAISLTVPSGETPGITLEFTVVDDNSCVANASTTSEITGADINVYRDAITQTGCDQSGEYNVNNCYTETNSFFTASCTQDAGTCLGPTDSDSTWTCSYSLWFTADPTDIGSQYPGTTWLGVVEAYDDNFATSTATEAETGVTLNQFLAFDIATTSIAYGALQAGDSNNPAPPREVQLQAIGNVGLDERLSGEDMCPGYPVCSGNATSTIFVWNQRYALSSTTWASATALTSTTTPEIEINVPKTTSTSTLAASSTYWGINIPVALTESGAYTGENTITGIVGEAVDW